MAVVIGTHVFIERYKVIRKIINQRDLILDNECQIDLAESKPLPEADDTSDSLPDKFRVD